MRQREREIIKITKSVISTYVGVDIKLDLVCVVVWSVVCIRQTILTGAQFYNLNVKIICGFDSSMSVVHAEHTAS